MWWRWTGYWCLQHCIVLSYAVLDQEARAGGVEMDRILVPAALYCIVSCCIGPRSSCWWGGDARVTGACSIVLYCAVLYCMILYCIVLYCIVLCPPGARAGGVETQGLLVPAAVARAGDAPGVPAVHAAGRLPAAPHLHDLHLRQHLSPPVAGSLPASLHPSRTVSNHHSFLLWLVVIRVCIIQQQGLQVRGQSPKIWEF